jgi:hypothetical protein
MKFRDFLLREAKIGDIVLIREYGWQIGMTRIDNENLYFHSLNPVLLELYNVVHFAYEERDWATKKVLVVDIRMNQGDDK